MSTMTSDQQGLNAAHLLAVFAILPPTTEVAWTTPNFVYVKMPLTNSFFRARVLEDGRIAVLLAKMGEELGDLARKRQETLKENDVDSMVVVVPLGAEGAYWPHDDSCFDFLCASIDERVMDSSESVEVPQ